MSRSPDPNRPRELLDDIVAYLVEHGLADLSLRPLAKAVGSSPRVLLYYFESSEKLVALALARLRERQREAFGELFAAPQAAAAAESSATLYLAAWRQLTAPAYLPLFRLFFEVYGLALREPERYRAFLTSAVDDWLDFIDDAAARKRYGRARSRALATVIVSGFRGFMLDYCASGDRERVDRAVKLWIDALVVIEADARRAAS